jgi:prepilin-type N-terminal cleavage/methylation domain-containing protein
MKNRNYPVKGFTLIEILVVMAIIATLAGLLFPAMRSAMEGAKKAQARTHCTAVAIAVNGYYARYNIYPLGATGTGGDLKIQGGNRAIIDILRAQGDPSTNPAKEKFISLTPAKNDARPRNGIDSAGDLYDPWGHPYEILIDSNYDETVADPFSGEEMDGTVLVWSVGRDGEAGTDDDVTTW